MHNTQISFVQVQKNFAKYCFETVCKNYSKWNFVNKDDQGQPIN